MDTFGKRLNYFRTKVAHLTQDEFAEKIGAVQQYITQYEKGKTTPNAERILAIQRAFPQLNIDWLMKGAGEMLLNNKTILYSYEEADKRSTIMNEKTMSLTESMYESLKSELNFKEREIERLWGMLSHFVAPATQKSFNEGDGTTSDVEAIIIPMHDYIEYYKLG